MKNRWDTRTIIKEVKLDKGIEVYHLDLNLRPEDGGSG